MKKLKSMLSDKKVRYASIIFSALILIVLGVTVNQIKLEGLNTFAARFTPGSAKPASWDYGLTKRCIKATNPLGANYYEDTEQCGSDGHNWTVAVESEKDLGASCPGPANQSLGINDATGNGPISMQWLPRAGTKNWSVNLTTDLSSKAHPCGDGYFTWVVLMDHMAHGGGPFPPADKLRFKSTINFNDYTPNGGTRAIVGVGGFITDASGVRKQFGIEINLRLTRWGDSDPAADIVTSVHDSSLDFLSMDGSAMGLSIPKNQDTPITINWYDIIPKLASRKLIPTPRTSWSQDSTITNVYIGHETNNFTKNNGAISSMWITDVKSEYVGTK